MLLPKQARYRAALLPDPSVVDVPAEPVFGPTSVMVGPAGFEPAT
ncbi:hypothetical protein WBP06_09215 [Novosphingobium sp. BL-8H]